MHLVFYIVGVHIAMCVCVCVREFVRPSDVSIGQAAGSWLISGGLSPLWFVLN